MAEKKNGAAGAVPNVVEAELVDEKDRLQLSKPLANGTKELFLDFDRVTGRTLISCEKQARKLDPAITVLALSQIYQALVGAAAAKIKYDEALDLSGKDFTALCIKAQNFLLP